MNIVLIGYRGAGKSTVGRRVAGHLGRKFLDTDDLVERREGRSIRAIVQSSGWGRFRAMEKEIIREAASGDDLVIAPGGGAIVDPENLARLKSNGWVLWLKADSEVLLSRIGRSRMSPDLRPSLTGRGTLEEVREVLAARDPLYQNAADAQVDTTRLSLDEVVERIVSFVKPRREGM